MGAKAKAKRQASNNVVKFNKNFHLQKNKNIDIVPRNRNQENYVLSLLNPTKSIVFGIGPAGTGKTLLACQSAVKSFLEKEVDKIISNTQVLTASGDPMEYGDPHFQDQLKRLTACSINFDYMPIYPINEQIAVDLLWDEI